MVTHGTPDLTPMIVEQSPGSNRGEKLTEAELLDKLREHIEEKGLPNSPPRRSGCSWLIPLHTTHGWVGAVLPIQ